MKPKKLSIFGTYCVQLKHIKLYYYINYNIYSIIYLVFTISFTDCVQNYLFS